MQSIMLIGQGEKPHYHSLKNLGFEVTNPAFFWFPNCGPLDIFPIFKFGK